MSQSRTPIAFGWVPNIGKTVTSEKNLHSNVDGRTHRVTNSDREYSFVCEGRRITASMDGKEVVEIETLDDSGLCVVYGIRPNPKAENVHYDSSSMHGAVWATFRELVDSSSDYCRCTAMDQLIQISEECDVPEKGCMCKEIVRRFIQALENITDVNIYVDDDPHSKAVFELDLDSVVRANVLYMDRFVDIYAEHLGDELDDYKSQIRCRKEKVAMVRSYHSERHRIQNANNVEALIAASNDLSKASRDLISKMTSYSQDIQQSVQRVGSLVERMDDVVTDLRKYSNSIDGQTKDIVKCIKSNKNLSIYMAVMSGISIMIAVASFLNSMNS